MSAPGDGRDDKIRAHLLRLVSFATEIEIEADDFAGQMGLGPAARQERPVRHPTTRSVAAARTSAGLALFQHQTRVKALREALAAAPARDPVARRLLELLDVIAPLAEAVQTLVVPPR
jgi:hypothetical protein